MEFFEFDNSFIGGYSNTSFQDTTTKAHEFTPKGQKFNIAASCGDVSVWKRDGASVNAGGTPVPCSSMPTRAANPNVLTPNTPDIITKKSNPINTFFRKLF